MRIIYIIKLALCISVLLILSACVDPAPPYHVPLETKNNYHSISSNKNLTVHVTDKLNDSEFIGGEDAVRKIKFKKIVPWLKQRLLSLNDLSCTLTHKTEVQVTLRKLYATVENDNLIGALVLNAKITRKNRKSFSRYYRGDCERSFFGIDEKKDLQSCFNDSLSLIILNMKHDICALNR